MKEHPGQENEGSQTVSQAKVPTRTERISEVDLGPCSGAHVEYKSLFVIGKSKKNRDNDPDGELIDAASSQEGKVAFARWHGPPIPANRMGSDQSKLRIRCFGDTSVYRW